MPDALEDVAFRVHRDFPPIYSYGACNAVEFFFSIGIIWIFLEARDYGVLDRLEKLEP